MAKGLAKFVHFNEVSFYYYWGKEIRSLYRGLRYIEVRSNEAVTLHPLLLTAIREMSKTNIDR